MRCYCVWARPEEHTLVHYVEQAHVDCEDHTCWAVGVKDDGLGSVAVEPADLQQLDAEVGLADRCRSVNADVANIEKGGRLLHCGFLGAWWQWSLYILFGWDAVHKFRPFFQKTRLKLKLKQIQKVDILNFLNLS